MIKNRSTNIFLKVKIMKLYEIKSEYLEIFEKAQEMSMRDDVTESEMIELENQMSLNDENFQEKALSYCQYITNLNQDTENIDKEIKRLQALKKPKQTLIDRLELNLSDAMKLIGKDKIDLVTFKLSFRKSSSISISDNAEIPEIYLRAEIVKTPDKKALKEAIEAGEEIKGVCIQNNQTLKIK